MISFVLVFMDSLWIQQNVNLSPDIVSYDCVKLTQREETWRCFDCMAHESTSQGNLSNKSAAWQLKRTCQETSDSKKESSHSQQLNFATQCFTRDQIIKSIKNEWKFERIQKGQKWNHLFFRSEILRSRIEKVIFGFSYEDIHDWWFCWKKMSTREIESFFLFWESFNIYTRSCIQHEWIWPSVLQIA